MYLFAQAKLLSDEHVDNVSLHTYIHTAIPYRVISVDLTSAYPNKLINNWYKVATI